MKKYMTLFTGIAAALAFSSTAAFAQEAENTVKFPELKATYLKTGDFVNLENLKKIAAGLHKDQVRLLLGNPHFTEGIGNPRVWDYAFNFYTGQMGGDYVTCQYQVQYDKDYHINATYWKDKQCEGFLHEAQPAPARVAEPITLSADGLFAFGKSSSADLLPAGHQKLKRLAEQVNKGYNLKSLEIVGHTDRIGSSASNMLLSKARAETVKTFLAANGVPSALMTARGAGSTQPVVTCAGPATAAVIACLQPNRRVDVYVNGSLKP